LPLRADSNLNSDLINYLICFKIHIQPARPAETQTVKRARKNKRTYGFARCSTLSIFLEVDHILLVGQMLEFYARMRKPLILFSVDISLTTPH
jgi:hypothetical protein